MIQELARVKKRLLDSHEATSKKRTDDEYRSGILTGLEMALAEIERMIESEDQAQARYYDEK